MRTVVAVGLLVAVAGLGAACTNASGSQLSATVPGSAEPAAVAAAGDETVGVAAPPPPANDGPTTTPPAGAVGTFDVVEVVEVGVPGIDSDDAFCAAWSRFGGSWQVIQVAANFAADTAVATTMEVAASPTVDQAYDAMFAAWPETLADERDLVADGFFGPLARRSEVAVAALVEVGATQADLSALADAWVAALAGRDPGDPAVLPELDDTQWALVDAAAVEFASRRVPIDDDPSMYITVETPLTDTHLATACPDQGSLAGTEIDGD